MASATKKTKEGGQPAAVEASEEKEILIVSQSKLYESDLKILFMPGVITPVPSITSWMQCQINAGIMELK